MSGLRVLAEHQGVTGSTLRLLLPALALTLLHPAEGVLPLRDQWAAACRALSRGRAAEAAALMEEFESWYGLEPAVQDPEFREPYLRLRGLTLLQTGDTESGIPLLEEWLEGSPGKGPFSAFIRFQLAQAYIGSGNDAAAQEHWERFLADHPDLPECALVHWMWADHLVRQERFTEAKGHLEKVLEENRLPSSGHALARAALALVGLRLGDHLAGLENLCPEGGTSPVLQAWRALLGPALARQLMQDGKGEEALLASTWFDRPEKLAGELASLRRPDRARAGIRGTIWNRHWSGQLGRLQSTAGSGLENLPDLGQLYRLRLLILLSSGRNKSALVLATALLQGDRERPAALRSAAYAGAIEACRNLRRWFRAEELAERFATQFPDDPALPDILFLQARTAAARHDLDRATALLERVRDLFPEHPRRRSWELTGAGWLLECGRAGEALAVLQQLAGDSPANWAPYILLEKARCRQALRQHREAAEDFQRVIQHPVASGILRERAWTDILKLRLSGMDWVALERDWRAYHEAFPEGINGLIVDHLAATAFRMQGRLGEAVDLLQKIVPQAGPPLASLAHGELSGIYRTSGDWEALQKHALDWILECRSSSNPIPEPALEDCLRYQRQHGRMVLPGALVRSLVEGLQEGTSNSSAGILFELLRDRWADYRQCLPVAETDYDSWIEERIHTALQAGDWIPYVTFQLEASRRLRQAGRSDSADARQIRILQLAPVDLLEEGGFFAVAAIAHAYDFPEAAALLESCLEKFPESERQPEALAMLAEERWEAGQTGEARGLLSRVIREWGDAPVHTPACLLMAEYSLHQGAYPDCLEATDRLLGKPGLTPDQAARGLLLRARADFRNAHPERALVGCRRILTLYPALKGIVSETAETLYNEMAGLAESQQDLARALLEEQRARDAEETGHA